MDISFRPSSAAHLPLLSTAKVREACFRRGIVRVECSPIGGEAAKADEKSTAAESFIKARIIMPDANAKERREGKWW